MTDVLRRSILIVTVASCVAVAPAYGQRTDASLGLFVVPTIALATVGGFIGSAIHRE